MAYLFALALVLAAVLLVAQRPGSSTSLPHASVPLPHTGSGLLGLPETSRGPVSATLGAASPAYRVVPGGEGFSAATPAEGLRTEFTSSGIMVRAGGSAAGLSLTSIGYGSALLPVSAVAPHASANRVTYSHPGLSEWYVNGPLGVEQGFTVSAPPATGGAGPLTFAVRLSGHATLSGQGVLFKSGGRTVLRYGGLRASDASGRGLPSHMRLEGHRLLLQVDTSGARYPLTIDPLIQQGPKLTAGGETGPGQFGWQVALSDDGNTALIGAPADNGNLGAAWVFTRSGTTWTQQGPKLTAGEEGANGAFGSSVALSGDGNTALIGVPGDKVLSGPQGSAWVFNRSGSTWTRAEKLTAPFGGAKDLFGLSVAISSDGSTAVAGAPGDEEGEGVAWIFKSSAGKWSVDEGVDSCEEREFPPGICIKREEETGEDGGLGASVALSSDGKTLVTGAPGDEGGSVWTYTETGLGIFPYVKSGGKIAPPSDATAKPEFGTAVALSSDAGTLLASGSNDNSGVGAVWAFTRSSFKWKQQGPKITAEGEVGPGEFGTSIALSADGNTAIVGSPEEENEAEHLEEAGGVWQFTRSEGEWTQQGGKFLGSGTQHELSPYGAEFGLCLALSADGETALVGGNADNLGLGAVWVFSTASGPPAKEQPKPLPPVEVPKGAPKITPAQIAALLGSGLIPSGKAAKIAALLKHGSFATKLSALEAGLATISWYQVPPGAKLAKKAKPKPVLVASGRLSFPTAGSGLLKLKLTGAGKRLLKHAKRLKLVARGSFTPSGGASVTATRPFVLKR